MKKTKAKGIKILKRNTTLNQLADACLDAGMQLEFRLIPKIPEIKNSNPDAGQQRFFVLCDRLTVYTSIGADNVHHASNKSTKLFGPHWSKVTQDAMHCRGYQHCTVAEFNELLRTL